MSEFLGYEVEVPFGPAAGAINGLSEEYLTTTARDVLASPAGGVWVGSFTGNGGEGNEPQYGVVYYHNKITGQTVNSLGLPNIGSRAAYKLWPQMLELSEEYSKPVIPSVSPGKGEDPMEVLPAMAAGFAEAGAPIIEVNYSCPNKVVEGGGREPVLGHDPDTMFAIDEKIQNEVGDSIWVIRKLPPYVADKKGLILPVAQGIAASRGRVAVSLSNTIGNQQILTELGEPALGVPNNLGGLSGPATIEVGREQLRQFKNRLPARVAIISCLGVMDGQEIRNRTEKLGADFASGVTVFMEGEAQGRSYGRTMLRLAQEYAEAA